MSVGPTGFIGSVAGTSLSQTKGTEMERTQQDASAQARQIKVDQTAENAAGIGETEQDEQTSERDADGRRLWENPLPAEDASQSSADQLQPPTSRDATGERGTQLDLSG